MARLADFHLHMGGQRGGQAQPRAKNLENQGVTQLDQLHPAARTDAKGLETLGFLVVSCDLTDHRANAWREQIQPDQSGGGWN